MPEQLEKLTPVGRLRAFFEAEFREEEKQGTPFPRDERIMAHRIANRLWSVKSRLDLGKFDTDFKPAGFKDPAEVLSACEALKEELRGELREEEWKKYFG